MQGTVYLLHLDTPLEHARHYLGWAQSLDKRLKHHRAGSGANMLRVAGERGIGFSLARTWAGDRTLEARLKRSGGRTRLCPACTARPRSPRGATQTFAVAQPLLPFSTN